MKATNGYTILEIKKQENKKSKSGLYLPQDSTSHTTNTGDRVGSNYHWIVKESATYPIGKEVIINPWQVQLFDRDEITYGVIPDNEVKVVFD